MEVPSRDHAARKEMTSGDIACQYGLWDRAIEWYRRALQREPDLIDAHCNMGVALAQKGDWEAAIASQRKAIEIHPNCVPAYNNLGSTLLISGRFDEAMIALNRAIALQPDMAEAHFTRSLILLLRGDFENGWKEYESRLGGRGVFMHKPTNLPRPRWDGRELRGKSILLHAEAGFGDSIQFVRYAPLVAKRGGKVIFGCQPELTELFRQIEGIHEFAVPSKPLPLFDVHCPLLSLPLAFGTTLDSIPWNGPYLQADPNRAQQWKARMPEGFKIGLSWRGDGRNRLDRWRSIGWQDFSRILSRPSVQFFSLQKYANVQVTDERLLDWTRELNDFNDTAAFVANLDLVITVDTAVAHLAGAMGKPVWALISASPDFRWMLDREDTPWYPSMRLFRQKTLGQWDDVIDRVLAALANLPNS
jgi:hypothetical protein